MLIYDYCFIYGAACVGKKVMLRVTKKKLTESINIFGKKDYERLYN